MGLGYWWVLQHRDKLGGMVTVARYPGGPRHGEWDYISGFHTTREAAEAEAKVLQKEIDDRQQRERNDDHG